MFDFVFFELKLEKIYQEIKQDEINSLKLYLWIDNGNRIKNAFYSWDAFGARLICENSEILSFCEALENL